MTDPQFYIHLSGTTNTRFAAFELRMDSRFDRMDNLFDKLMGPDGDEALTGRARE